MSQVLTHIEAGVLRVVLNRPDKKNALTAAMYEELNEAFDRAAAEPEVRAILFAAEGPAFCAGNDLADFQANPPRGPEAPVMQFIRNLACCQKPMVAAVRGPAVGIGATMLLHCDLVYAADDAVFALPFARLGLCPEAASSLLLPRLAGLQRATEKLLLGEPFGVDEALEMGFVNRLVPPDELLAYALRQAAKLVALPVESVRATRELLRGISGKGTAGKAHEALLARIDEEGAMFERLLAEPSAQAAFAAFLSGQKPGA
ncbi:enoyl-CoA hydratase [Derxia gummosa]|uniref:Enoyl-CoA hydratase n=1 Tax=Derxia gummosa DSM 723 TaxID=1121388 RepID=A0A8B6X5B8_9BURK|nr:enoyl-CoA hydratase [Derxia gummosa]